MAEIRLNKTELKNQKGLLAQLTKYLPTLQLKKQQLQAEVEVIRNSVAELEEGMKKLRESIEPWSILFSQKLTTNILVFLQIETILREHENIAGVEVPVFKEIAFKDIAYSHFMMPVWFDKGLIELKKVISQREKLKVGAERLALLEEELRQTNIKVNLFEKRMIPECKENIRRIKIFLGDQEIAAICNAKIAKDKLNRRELEEESV